MSMLKNIIEVSLAVLVFLIIIPGVAALQCYYCRGVTHYDPNDCFRPSNERTLTQECQKGEVCEKKITRVDAFQQVVERGCSSNCDGRKYIWTEDFRVHCCGEDNLCNSAVHTTSAAYSVVLFSLVFSVLRQILQS